MSNKKFKQQKYTIEKDSGCDHSLKKKEILLVSKSEEHSGFLGATMKPLTTLLHHYRDREQYHDRE